jgi:hypothetical protein
MSSDEKFRGACASYPIANPKLAWDMSRSDSSLYQVSDIKKRFQTRAQSDAKQADSVGPETGLDSNMFFEGTGRAAADPQEALKIKGDLKVFPMGGDIDRSLQSESRGTSSASKELSAGVEIAHARHEGLEFAQNLRKPHSISSTTKGSDQSRHADPKVLKSGKKYSQPHTSSFEGDSFKINGVFNRASKIRTSHISAGSASRGAAHKKALGAGRRNQALRATPQKGKASSARMLVAGLDAGAREESCAGCWGESASQLAAPPGTLGYGALGEHVHDAIQEGSVFSRGTERKPSDQKSREVKGEKSLRSAERPPQMMQHAFMAMAAIITAAAAASQLQASRLQTSQASPSLWEKIVASKKAWAGQSTSR